MYIFTSGLCFNLHTLYTRGADKSLARPVSKQATATKLGIYSTYCPRSSIHFLASCSNFCKTLKKKKSKIFRPTRSPRQQWTPRRTKNGELSIVFFFQSRELVVVRRGQIRRIEWVIKIWEAQVGQFLLGCKCLVSRSIVVQEQDNQFQHSKPACLSHSVLFNAILAVQVKKYFFLSSVYQLVFITENTYELRL